MLRPVFVFNCAHVSACVCVHIQLISLIENNSVVIIRGATGSGKTTQLPQYILDHYTEKNASCNIVVTQPRKIGATSIARWVATQRKCTLGSLVGYQVGAVFRTNYVYLKCAVLEITAHTVVFSSVLTLLTKCFCFYNTQHTLT